MSRACRWCKSPSRGNPCWRHITLKGKWIGDPPCVLYYGEEDYTEQSRRDGKIGAWIVAGIAFSAIVFWLSYSY